MVDVAKQCQRTITDAAIERLARELGVMSHSLRQLQVGWSPRYRAYAFPMRDVGGGFCGVRYRAMDGSKFSERGSREGLFFSAELLTSDYLVIVEGASDTAAMLSLGYSSCVGRASCQGNVEQIVNLCRRRNFRRVVILPDADKYGWHGARNLAEYLLQRASVTVDFLNLPAGIKDVRQCIHQKENADWLADQIRKLIPVSPEHGGISNDNLV